MWEEREGDSPPAGHRALFALLAAELPGAFGSAGSHPVLLVRETGKRDTSWVRRRGRFWAASCWVGDRARSEGHTRIPNPAEFPPGGPCAVEVPAYTAESHQPRAYALYPSQGGGQGRRGVVREEKSASRSIPASSLRSPPPRSKTSVPAAKAGKKQLPVSRRSLTWCGV
jgi:hypothetical protein